MKKPKKNVGAEARPFATLEEEKIYFDITLELEKIEALNELWMNEEIRIQPPEIQRSIFKYKHRNYFSELD